MAKQDLDNLKKVATKVKSYVDTKVSSLENEAQVINEVLEFSRGYSVSNEVLDLSL